MHVTVTIAARKESVAVNDGSVYPGIDVVSLKSDQVDTSNLPDKARGALVVNVAPKSVGDVVGLRAGDIITAVGDHIVTNVKEFYRYLNDSSTKLSFTILRDGQSLTTMQATRP